MSEKKERMFSAAEVEAILEKRFSAAERKVEARVQQAYAEGFEQAHRMTAAAAEENGENLERRENILQERERQLFERECKAKAAEILAENGLPLGLAAFVPCTDEDSFNRGIVDIQDIFRQMLQEEIDERLRATGHSLPRPPHFVFSSEGLKQPEQKADSQRILENYK